MSIPLFHYIELVISCVQKEEKSISRIKYTRYESHLYIYKFNTKDSTLQQSKKKKERRFESNDSLLNRPCEMDRQMNRHKDRHLQTSWKESICSTRHVRFFPLCDPRLTRGKKKEKERVEDAFSSSPRIREERWREDATPLTDRVRHNGRESGNNDFSRCSQNFRPSYCHVSALLRLLSRAFFFLFLFL